MLGGFASAIFLMMRLKNRPWGTLIGESVLSSLYRHLSPSYPLTIAGASEIVNTVPITRPSMHTTGHVRLFGKLTQTREHHSPPPAHYNLQSAAS